MPVVTLSADFIKTVPIPAKGKVDSYDNAITGFILEVRASGGKTLSIRYKDQHSVLKQHKIGPADSISFDKARQAATVLRSRIVLGEDPSQERKAKRLIPTLAEFVTDRYMPHIQSTKRSWDTDDSMLRNHVLPRFGKCHLDTITQDAVSDFYHGMVRTSGYAQGTANRMLVMFKTLMNLAKRWQIPGAEKNPIVGIDLVDPQNARERFLTPEETQRLRLAIEDSDNPQLKHIVGLLLLCGCRKRELLDARWEDIDLERKSWRIPMTKNGKPRHVPLSSAALSVLSQVPRWEGCPYVLPNPKTKLPFVSFFCSWNTARKQAGLPDVRCHDLRHSFASNCINKQVSIFEVSKLLGHSQVSTTARYSHLSQETLLAAVEASASGTGADWGQAQTAKAGENSALVEA